MNVKPFPVQEWSVEGRPLVPGKEPRLAEGVRGCAFDLPEGVYISLVISEEPASGNVSAWLDRLPSDRRIVFTSVISPQLRGMLLRRHFKVGHEYGLEVLERGKAP